MLLIAGKRSNKTNLYLLNEWGERIFIETEGFNTYPVSIQNIQDSITSFFVDKALNKFVSKIYYCGWDCFPQTSPIILNAIFHDFTYVEIAVQLALVAVALALLGSAQSFTAIMGTGTNSCLYYGKQKKVNSVSLGFISGDVKSRALLGTRPMTNQFCRTFALFIHQHFNHPYHSSIPITYYRSFLINIVSGYTNYKHLSFNNAGSIGYNISDNLKK